MGSDSKQPTYVLVDGSSYLFRAYYALPDLRNSKGEATGAIRGVISMIKKLEKDFPESLVVVVFCLLYTSPSPRDRTRSRMPSSA